MYGNALCQACDHVDLSHGWYGALLKRFAAKITQRNDCNKLTMMGFWGIFGDEIP
jgi:hypothetical protein